MVVDCYLVSLLKLPVGIIIIWGVSSLVQPPSSHDRIYYCGTFIHTYGDYSEVQERIHLRASAKTKKLLKDKKNMKDREIMSFSRTKHFT